MNADQQMYEDGFWADGTPRVRAVTDPQRPDPVTTDDTPRTVTANSGLRAFASNLAAVHEAMAGTTEEEAMAAMGDDAARPKPGWCSECRDWRAGPPGAPCRWHGLTLWEGPQHEADFDRLINERDDARRERDRLRAALEQAERERDEAKVTARELATILHDGRPINPGDLALVQRALAGGAEPG